MLSDVKLSIDYLGTVRELYNLEVNVESMKVAAPVLSMHLFVALST